MDTGCNKKNTCLFILENSRYENEQKIFYKKNAVIVFIYFLIKNYISSSD